MKHFITALVACLLFINIASAQVAGPAPAFSVVHGTKPDKGLLEIARVVEVREVVPVQEAVNVNGVIMNVTRYIERIVHKQIIVTMDIRASRVVTPDGKQLPIDEVWKRLKKDSVIVISGSAELPAAAYLRALNSETLVLIAAPPKKMDP